MEASGGGVEEALVQPQPSTSSTSRSQSSPPDSSLGATENSNRPKVAQQQQQQQQHLGQERDKPEADYALLKDSVIQAIRDLRSDMDMCDVTFLVGMGPKVEIKANSTILSLRSPYFKVSLHHHLFHLI